MITQISFDEKLKLDTKTKYQKAIMRLKELEPTEGYYLAFSGGKDSQCIYHLAKDAGVKFEAHYNVTGIDPPELVYFIRENYPDVICDMYDKSMFKLIENKGLPTRLHRFCCEHLKEHGGEGRRVVTGVRWAESVRRKKNRSTFEIFAKKQKNRRYTDDNDEGRRMTENCIKKGKIIVNPIIDWECSDVWEYIHAKSLKYCLVYDCGYKRLGCIGCPMGGTCGMTKDFERYPKFKKLYLNAIEKFLAGYFERCKLKNKEPFLTTADEWMQWWISGKKT
jgi:phosphoadenosine phosphosulfate reductase